MKQKRKIEPRLDEPGPAMIDPMARRHMAAGWWSLLVFLGMGVALETLHGFKVAWYLDVASSTRRHMWTLAHAHGTLLAVVNLVAGASLHRVPREALRRLEFASKSLLGAGVLLPAGFFLGGMFPYAGDPGVGVVLVPIGAVLLAIAVYLFARSCSAS